MKSEKITCIIIDTDEPLDIPEMVTESGLPLSGGKEYSGKFPQYEYNQTHVKKSPVHIYNCF